MKTTYTAAIVLALATLVTGQAMAFSKASAEATDPMTGMTFRQISADADAAKAGVSGKTRAQVRAEVQDARRNADSRDTKEPMTGMTFREILADADVAKAGVSGKTRAQVRAEVQDARRNADSRDTKEPMTGITFRELSGK